jgi:hypothetical protein
VPHLDNHPLEDKVEHPFQLNGVEVMVVVGFFHQAQLQQALVVAAVQEDIAVTVVEEVILMDLELLLLIQIAVLVAAVMVVKIAAAVAAVLVF